MSFMSPTRDRAPGPGGLAAEFTSARLVAGMQKVDASLMLFVVPTGSRVPAGAPTSRKLRHAALPKQPTVVCEGQNAPVALLCCEVPVVSGVRFTPMMPAEMLPSEPPAAQSFDS